MKGRVHSRGYGAAVIVRDGLPTMPGCEDVIMPGRAPLIEKPNPWGDVPNVDDPAVEKYFYKSSCD